MKKTKGITLISLIITILIMLILIGVTITAVINSGLIGKAQGASKKQEEAYEKESQIEGITVNGKEYSSPEDYVQGIPTVKAGERAKEKSKYTDGKNIAIIPAGFTVSGISTEKTIEGGLVIYLIPEDITVDWEGTSEDEDAKTVAYAQKNYDQFVWIPIEDINDMYMCQNEDGTKSCKITVKEIEGKKQAYCTTHNSTQMAGRLYITGYNEPFNANATNQTYRAGHGLREPDTVPESDGVNEYLGILSEMLEPNATTKEYTSIENFKAKLQEEYNEVVKSVYLSEGFYVGRYETSNMTETSGTAVKVVKGTNSGITNINWYYMYAQQVKYAENKKLDLNSVGSTMIQGAAYDQVMKFVDTEDYDVTTAGNVRHDFDAAYKTGSQSADQSKNIYDLEGNLYTWTTEVCYIDSRVFRGGSFKELYSACSYAGASPMSTTDNRLTTLLQLYVE